MFEFNQATIDAVNRKDVLERLRYFYSAAHDPFLTEEQRSTAEHEFTCAADDVEIPDEDQPDYWQRRERYLRDHLPTEIADAVLQQYADLVHDLAGVGEMTKQ